MYHNYRISYWDQVQRVVSSATSANIRPCARGVILVNNLKNVEKGMMGMRGKKKSIACAVLVFLMCAAFAATVSATTVDFGKINPKFIQNGVLFQNNPVNPGDADTVKMVFTQSNAAYYNTLKSPAIAQYTRKIGSYSPVSYNAYRLTLPVTFPVITPVPEQGIGVTSIPGSSNSTLGGFIIRAPEGDWISMRSNFYNPSKEIYSGRWNYNVGTTPAYWENMALPGSYTIQIARKDTGLVYYCETVTVLPGQTVVIQVYNSMCPLCSSCY